MRSRLYYTWHLNPNAQTIHLAILALVTIANLVNIGIILWQYYR